LVGFHGVWTCGAKGLLNIEWFLHWKLNWIEIVAESFLEELECAEFGVVGKIWMSRILMGIYLVRFGFGIVGGEYSTNCCPITVTGHR
jgi:hypothetical protein